MSDLFKRKAELLVFKRLDSNFPLTTFKELRIVFDITFDNKSSNNTAKITVYNILGRHIKTLVNTKKNPGRYKFVWSGTDENNVSIAAGIYFYKMEAVDFVKVKKMVFMQ